MGLQTRAENGAFHAIGVWGGLSVVAAAVGGSVGGIDHCRYVGGKRRSMAGEERVNRRGRRSQPADWTGGVYRARLSLPQLQITTQFRAD
jgi:hypothetical protein